MSVVEFCPKCGELELVSPENEADNYKIFEDGSVAFIDICRNCKYVKETVIKPELYQPQKWAMITVIKEQAKKELTNKLRKIGINKNEVKKTVEEFFKDSPEQWQKKKLVPKDCPPILRHWHGSKYGDHPVSQKHRRGKKK